jgi:hypothetical protein
MSSVAFFVVPMKAFDRWVLPWSWSQLFLNLIGEVKPTPSAIQPSPQRGGYVLLHPLHIIASSTGRTRYK